MRTPTSTPPDPLAQPWLPLLRWISSGVITLALVAMAVSLIVVVSRPPQEAPPTRTIFSQDAPAQRSRLEHDPLAWVPLAALGIAALALGARVFADRREARIRVLRARLGLFPPPQPSRWDRVRERWLGRPPG